MNTIERKEFTNIWKKISNSPKRKPTFSEVNASRYDGESKNYSHFLQKVKVKGFIYPEHHVLYNIARCLPLTRGFTEGSKGLEEALKFFKNKSSVQLNNKIYEPFKGLITNETYCEMIEEARTLIFCS